MKRREFMVLFGGAAMWPLAVRAQQSEGVRRIGVLMGNAANDPEGQARISAFLQGLQELGWGVGDNVRIYIRWTSGNDADIRKFAVELVALAPDVILSSGTPPVTALQQATRTVPIVFTVVADPVGSGVVDSLARPGGNATGFISQEYGLSAKQLELLKQVAPLTTRVGVVRDPTTSAGVGQFAAIQSAAPSLGMEVVPINVRDAAEIERGITAFVRSGSTGLIVTGSPLTALHRNLIIALAAQHKLPAVYATRFFVNDGGLISYGTNLIDQHRKAAGYVDRILKGEKPADLPVQTPIKYELVVNLKTAKAMGFTFPLAVLARADEVIE